MCLQLYRCPFQVRVTYLSRNSQVVDSTQRQHKMYESITERTSLTPMTEYVVPKSMPTTVCRPRKPVAASTAQVPDQLPKEFNLATVNKPRRPKDDTHFVQTSAQWVRSRNNGGQDNAKKI